MASSKTLQAIVEIAGSLSPTLGKAAEEASKSLEGINLKAVAVGAGVAAAGAAIGKATIEAGKYLVDLGGQFDNVVDTIRIGTGATGDALDALTDDFNEVYKTYFPVDPPARIAMQITDLAGGANLEIDGVAII